MGILHITGSRPRKTRSRITDQWKRRQITRVENTIIEMAEKIDDSTVRRNTIRESKTRKLTTLMKRLNGMNLDYGRKLYLIRKLHLWCGHPAYCCSDFQTPLFRFPCCRPEN